MLWSYLFTYTPYTDAGDVTLKDMDKLTGTEPQQTATKQ